ncbi:MAG: sulfatase [Phycisphaerales bacterium]
MSRPNIVLILIDDMGWVDIGCYGSEFYETPNIDRLFARGMRFTDAYAACPVCSPTRASILTGRYPARIGLTQYLCGRATGKLLDVPYIDHLPLTEKTVATSLREGGYQTWHVGKWHLGPEPYWPEKQGFDVNIGGCDWGHPHQGYFSPWGIATLGEDGVAPGTYLDDHLTDRTIALIEQRDWSRPFFLNLWYYLVHTPMQAPPEVVAKYETKARRMGLDKMNPIEVGEHFACDHKKHLRIERRTIQSHPVYAAMVETLDANIGRVMDALEKAGERDNTLIVFTSDNGGLSTAEGSPTCNAPLSEGKGWMYEGGNREPLIIAGPDVPAGSVCREVVTSTDFYPTFLELAGLPLNPQQHCDGVSMLPLLKNPHATLDREAIYWHYPHYSNQGGTPGSSVRSGDWKLIEFFEDGELELYHLRDDIEEKHNRVKDEPAITQRLHGMLKRWREEIEAIVPEPNPDYVPSNHPAADPRV